jgi:hypothetical protein
MVLVYPMTTGRNFDEVLRVIDSLQLTAKHKVATPVNWRNGEDVIIAGSVSDEDARKQYPQGWKAPKPYIRIVPRCMKGSLNPGEASEPHPRGHRLQPGPRRRRRDPLEAHPRAASRVCPPVDLGGGPSPE